MDDFIAAVGLVLIFEGALYALFPAFMQRVMAQVLEMPPAIMRNGGLLAAVVGFGIVWLVRR